MSNNSLYCYNECCSGHSQNNDEALIDDLMSILKNEVSNKKNKNVDVLSLSSQICLKLNGKLYIFKIHKHAMSTQVCDLQAAKVAKIEQGCQRLWKKSTFCRENLTSQITSTRKHWIL